MPNFVVRRIRRPSQERRRAVRYKLKLPLKYVVLKADAEVEQGAGVTQDISHTGVRFTPEVPINPGASVRVFIDWPAATENRPLLLGVSGYVLRSRGRDVILIMNRHILGPASEVGRSDAISRRGPLPDSGQQRR